MTLYLARNQTLRAGSIGHHRSRAKTTKSMDAPEAPIVWKTIIYTIVTVIMSSIIPIDLTAFATDASYCT